MFGKLRSWQWLLGVGLLAAVECAGLVAVEVAISSPARAQFWGDRPYQSQRRYRSNGFFQNFFGPPRERFYERPYERPYEREQRLPATREHTDSSRAPPPRKTDSAVAPTTSIVVMGDGMADWLAHGLEDAFADAPEVAVVRQNKFNSGLIRYEAKSDLDWWHVARELLAKDKANYVVMMLGISDRQSIRERDVAKEASKDVNKETNKEAGKDSKNPPDSKTPNKTANKTDDAEQGAAIAPEPKTRPSNGVIEFRTERWAEVYARRIDETIAALKSKGVPVFWVGLPSIRGTRSTSEASYLNELYRARAERAGAVYVDVWDGFVDESGRYSNFGPDLEGQTRRLRSSDGVFFTEYGARKLAHYVEREIRRYMANRAPVALPMGPLAPVPPTAKSTVRPLAGPVVPLTVTTENSDQLAGAAVPQPGHGDAVASQVLVRGDAIRPPSGRADDFTWPGGNDAAKPGDAAKPAEPVASAPPVAPVEAPPAAPAKPSADLKSAPEPKHAPAEKTVQKEVKPKALRPPPPQVRPRPRLDDDAPRPPAPIGRTGGPFGWAR